MSVQGHTFQCVWRTAGKWDNCVAALPEKALLTAQCAVGSSASKKSDNCIRACFAASDMRKACLKLGTPGHTPTLEVGISSGWARCSWRPRAQATLRCTRCVAGKFLETTVECHGRCFYVVSGAAHNQACQCASAAAGVSAVPNSGGRVLLHSSVRSGGTDQVRERAR